jgi:hypothetical protein
LVKYADSVPYYMGSRDELQSLAQDATAHSSDEWCTLIDYEREGEDRILAAALYRFGGQPFDSSLARLRGLPAAEREAIAQALLGRLGEHDTPLRELEYSTYTFDLVMDQGAYAEFKRHRMMTQTPQRLTTRLGYTVPRLIAEAGLSPRYAAAMDRAASLFEALHAFNPYVAQYVVPNGYHRRVLARFNLREAYAFCQLRSAPNAHFSIRRIAQRVAGEIRRIHPLLSRYMRLPAESPEDVAQAHFADSTPLS